MAENAKRPISDVGTFLEEARKAGCYDENRYKNNMSVFTLLTTKLMPDASLDPATSAVADVEPKIPELLGNHGRTSSIKASSIRQYTARLEKLLKDFKLHDGGDFYAWKQELERTTTRRKSTKRSNGKSDSSPGTETAPVNEATGPGQRLAVPDDFIIYPFRLRRDLTIQIPLPADLTTDDVKRLHQWMNTLPVEWSDEEDEAED